MAAETSSSDVPLPKSWPSNVKSAILRVVSLAHLAIIYSRSWAANNRIARVRLQGKLERSRNEVKDAEPLGAGYNPFLSAPSSWNMLFPLPGMNRVCLNGKGPMEHDNTRGKLDDDLADGGA